MAVDEPMTSHMFDKLDSCDPFLAWELCRNYVGYQLLGREPVTVPFLDEGYHYVPFGVIVKKHKRDVRNLFTRDQSLATNTIIGSMINVLAPQVDRTPFRQKPERVTEYNFNDRFIFRMSGMKHGVKKSIKIKINGTECFDVCLSMELGKLVLDKRLPELVDVKKIYVIYEVFYAQMVSVSVTIGEQQAGSQYMDTNNRKFTNERRMPIGFTAQKFPLMSNGCVGFMEQSTLESLRDGKWKRVSRLKSDPLPPTPAYSERMVYDWQRENPPLLARRNPQDVLPALPGDRHDRPLPDPPSSSSS